MVKTKMEIDEKMEYAIKLADPNVHHEYEDLFKLSTLCEEIGTRLQTGGKASATVAARFNDALKSFYAESGDFRTEVEHFATAKRLAQDI
ncbi:MAG: hypothetical protein ACI8W8_002087 [Rhodothermales bacterium]|jgi:hypothetical protein